MGNSSDNTPEQTAKIYPLRSTRPCPECGKPSTREFYPFCSPRCRAIDLNRWLSGSYVLPGKPFDNADEEE